MKVVFVLGGRSCVVLVSREDELSDWWFGISNWNISEDTPETPETPDVDVDVVDVKDDVDEEGNRCAFLFMSTVRWEYGSV
jgi:hypothetical protein